jgi:hypothetical protein
LLSKVELCSAKVPLLPNKAPPLSSDEQCENAEKLTDTDEKIGGSGRLTKTSVQIAPPEPVKDLQYENTELKTSNCEP